MAEALIILAVCLLASLWTLFLVVRMLSDERRNAETRWAKERSVLLDRIQRPDRLPVEAATEYVIPERMPDEWAKVGTLNVDPEYGLDDE